MRNLLVCWGWTDMDSDLYTHQPMKKAWEVLKMTQIQMTPQQYIDQGERHRVNALEPILAPDPAQNMSGAMDVGRGHELTDHASVGRYNQYLPMTTDRPLQADTLQQARDAGYTVVTEGSEPGGQRTYDFRTESAKVPFNTDRGLKISRYGDLTDYDQRSRQPLPREGQEAASIALGRKLPGEFYSFPSYVPKPPHQPPTREQLGRMLQDPKPEDIERIMNLFGEENKTARAIGAMRGHKGGKYGSEFAREQAGGLLRDWRKKMSDAKRQASWDRIHLRNAVDAESEREYENRLSDHFSNSNKWGLSRGYHKDGFDILENQFDHIPEYMDFRDAKRKEQGTREAYAGLREHILDPLERAESDVENRAYWNRPENKAIREERERERERQRERRAAWDPEAERAAYLQREKRREERRKTIEEAEAEKQRKRAENRGTVGVRKPKKRKFGTTRGGRR
jgi:hypothetical protein